MRTKSYKMAIAFSIGLLSIFASACTAPPATDSASMTDLPSLAPPTDSNPTLVEDSGLRLMQVEAVNVEIGMGEPIPVDVVVSGTWPDLCAQLARLEQQILDGWIEISLLADSAKPDCPLDYLGLPFRMVIPLNMVERLPAQYTVVVNGVATSFEWTGALPEEDMESRPSTGHATIAYIGLDGNLWVIQSGSDEPRQITQDGTGDVSNGADPAPLVNYYFPEVSWDGRYVATRRDAGTPIESGMQYDFGLWVYDLVEGEERLVYDQNPAGFAWKPGSHLLAYGRAVDQGYFINRSGQPDASLATGIWEVDLDTGVVSELVKPERGYALYGPVWSPNGRYLSFDELLYMEGRGPFAYFDFEMGQYVPWEEPLGMYAWSPDSRQIAYDRLTYAATGQERIFIRALQEGQESQISSELDAGYAYYPEFSPLGDRIAYLSALGGPDSYQYNLTIQDLASGEVRDLGVFEGVWNLQWTPDGEHLIFSAGPYGAMQILQVSVADGTGSVLAQGHSPAVAGR